MPISPSDQLTRAMNSLYLALPEDVADAVITIVRAREHELMVALGYFLNAQAYADTFPDDAEDATQLRKDATRNMLTARALLSERDQFECGERMKAHVTAQPEWKEYEAKIRATLAEVGKL